MAAPTITTITPATGHSGGGTVVEVVGTGFNLPATGLLLPAVTVTVGGAEAEDVQVASATLLYFTTPKGDPDAAVAADIVITNVDANGDPEGSATASAAWTFVRPSLVEKGTIVLVAEALITELRRQVLANTVVTTSTDYDAETGDELNFAAVNEVPAIVLANFEIADDSAYSPVAPVEVDASGERFVERRDPVPVALRCNLVGVANGPLQALTLLETCKLFFAKNVSVELDRTAYGLSPLTYDLMWVPDSSTPQQNNMDGANISTFSGQVTIRGILLEDMPGLPTSKPGGIPSYLPHESTTRYGWKSADSPAALDMTVTPKPE